MRVVSIKQAVYDENDTVKNYLIFLVFLCQSDKKYHMNRLSHVVSIHQMKPERPMNIKGEKIKTSKQTQYHNLL